MNSLTECNLCKEKVHYEQLIFHECKKFNLEYDSTTGIISFNNEKIASWNDDAIIDYPEDLSWSRDIGDLCNKIFKKGIELGKKKAKKEYGI